MRGVYKRFLTQNRLKPSGSIRLVSMRTVDFSVAVWRLDNADLLSFESSVLAEAVDGLRERLHGKVPRKRGWMAGAFVEVVTEGIARNAGMFGPKNDETGH